MTYVHVFDSTGKKSYGTLIPKEMELLCDFQLRVVIQEWSNPSEP